jgi:hypothetical protein
MGGRQERADGQEKNLWERIRVSRRVISCFVVSSSLREARTINTLFSKLGKKEWWEADVYHSSFFGTEETIDWAPLSQEGAPKDLLLDTHNTRAEGDMGNSHGTFSLLSDSSLRGDTRAEWWSVSSGIWCSNQTHAAWKNGYTVCWGPLSFISFHFSGQRDSHEKRREVNGYPTRNEKRPLLSTKKPYSV